MTIVASTPSGAVRTFGALDRRVPKGFRGVTKQMRNLFRLYFRYGMTIAPALAVFVDLMRRW
jgi:hypothetical protein